MNGTQCVINVKKLIQFFFNVLKMGNPQRNSSVLNARKWRLKMQGKYFTEKELSCKCGCGKPITSRQFIDELDGLREALGVPLVITSGMRCETHNKLVGGKPNSAHLKGLAVDIECQASAFRFQLIETALSLGWLRVGIAKNFIHLDRDDSLVQKLIWIY